MAEVDDKSEYQLAMAKDDFLIQISKTNREEIFRNTLGQSINPLWQKARMNRITASNFGAVCKMRQNTSTHNLVKNMLKGANIRSKALQYGTLKENEAKQAFKNATNFAVRESGFFVDIEYPFIAASPDGLVSENAILGIKCPYTAKDFTILEAINEKLITYLEHAKTNGEAKITLKSNHNYMYQIQGQLHISRRSHCYFVVYTRKIYL